MSKQLTISIMVWEADDLSGPQPPQGEYPQAEARYAKTITVDADLMHPADDPAITLRGVQTAIDYVLQQEKK
jgi:hypothetical protein